MAAGANAENLKFVKPGIAETKVSETERKRANDSQAQTLRFVMDPIGGQDHRLEQEARGVLQPKRAPADQAGAPSKGE